MSDCVALVIEPLVASIVIDCEDCGDVVTVEDGSTEVSIVAEAAPLYPGSPGPSAYEVAVSEGFDGSEPEWLSSLIGGPGASAYDVAVAHGFSGSEIAWLASLAGPAGPSAYAIAVSNGFQGSSSAWLASLVGSNGRSAYEIAVAAGFPGTLNQWLASLVGTNGQSAYQLAVSNGFSGTLSQWLASLHGVAGENGLNWRRDWDGQNDYAERDGVSYNGSSYVASADIPASATEPYEPSEYDLWLEPASLGLSDGASIAAWPSSSGSVVLAQGSAGSRPTFVANQLNGLPAVRFDGSDFLMSADTLLNKQGDWALAVVLKTHPSNGEGMVAMWGEVAPNMRRAFWASQGAGNINFSGYNANVQSGVPSSSPTIAVLTRISGAMTIHVNGVLSASGAPSLVGSAFYGFALGGNFDGSEPWRGDLFAVVFDDAMDRQRVEGYLAHRFGMQSSLPGAHPFKASAPFQSTDPANDSRWDILAERGTDAEGNDGASAYQIAVDAGFVGSEGDWLSSLAGDDGPSAYQIALSNGFVGTEAEWLASLSVPQSGHVIRFIGSDMPDTSDWEVDELWLDTSTEI